MAGRLTQPLVVALLLLAAALAGCSDRHYRATRPVYPGLEPPPAPNTPVAAVRLLAWGWNYRSEEAIGQTLAGNFRFVFAAGDVPGDSLGGTVFTRDGVRLAVRHLFLGTPSLPAASSIDLQFTPVLSAGPDPRPGKDPTVHAQVLTPVTLRVQAGPSAYFIQGTATFYLVRGDSAVIPTDLGGPGGAADPYHWFIEEHDDGTGPLPVARAASGPRAPGARAAPSAPFTWGDLLRIYR